MLADGGFDINESVGLYCDTVKLPAFTKEKKQLLGIDVEQTWHIANVCIHVEKEIVIGNIRRNYSFLNICQFIDFLTQKPDDVTVSCSLNNLCDSIVPID